jgi:hypothetical protein
MSIELTIGIIGTIVSLLVGGLTILATVVGGFVWLSGKLEKINVSIANTVTHTQCSDRRDKCPCVKDIEEIKEKMEDRT